MLKKVFYFVIPISLLIGCEKENETKTNSINQLTDYEINVNFIKTSASFDSEVRFLIQDSLFNILKDTIITRGDKHAISYKSQSNKINITSIFNNNIYSYIQVNPKEYDFNLAHDFWYLGQDHNENTYEGVDSIKLINSANPSRLDFYIMDGAWNQVSPNNSDYVMLTCTHSSPNSYLYIVDPVLKTYKIAILNNGDTIINLSQMNPLSSFENKSITNSTFSNMWCSFYGFPEEGNYTTGIMFYSNNYIFYNEENVLFPEADFSKYITSFGFYDDDFNYYNYWNCSDSIVQQCELLDVSTINIEKFDMSGVIVTFPNEQLSCYSIHLISTNPSIRIEIFLSPNEKQFDPNAFISSIESLDCFTDDEFQDLNVYSIEGIKADDLEYQEFLNIGLDIDHSDDKDISLVKTITKGI